MGGYPSEEDLSSRTAIIFTHNVWHSIKIYQVYQNTQPKEKKKANKKITVNIVKKIDYKRLLPENLNLQKQNKTEILELENIKIEIKNLVKCLTVDQTYFF